MPAERSKAGATVTSTLNAHAALVPTTTRVSMLVVPWRAARNAAR